MTNEAGREPARDPQDLERLLVSRERAGDVDGMAALYEAHAVLDCGDGQLLQGRKPSERSTQDWSGDLALTSTRLPNGSVTTEIARQQSDRTWLWVIDRFEAS